MSLCPSLKMMRTIGFTADYSQRMINYGNEADSWALDENGYYYGSRSSFNVAFNQGFPKLPTFKANTQYTLSLNGYNNDATSSTQFQIIYTDGTKTTLSISGTTPTDYSVTSTAGKTIDKIVGTFGSLYYVVTYIKNVQLEEGTSKTTYNPYTNTVYGGYYTVNEDGSVDLVAETANVVFDGSEDEEWYKYNGGSASAYAVGISLPNFGYVNTTTLIWQANYLKAIDGYVTWGNYDAFISALNAEGIKCGVRNVSTTVEAWRTYLASKPLQVVYKLATPITYHLGNIGQLKSLKGINNVWSDTGDTTVEYWKL